MLLCTATYQIIFATTFRISNTQHFNVTNEGKNDGRRFEEALASILEVTNKKTGKNLLCIFAVKGKRRLGIQGHT